MKGLSVQALSLTGAVMLCWLALAIHREIAHGRTPRSPFRSKDYPFLAATLVLGGLWFFTFIRPLSGKGQAVAAAGVATAQTQSISGCSSVAPAMKSQRVTAILGKPEKISSEEDIYGPGAELWSFEKARCAVHLIDGVVERVD